MHGVMTNLSVHVQMTGSVVERQHPADRGFGRLSTTVVLYLSTVFQRYAFEQARKRQRLHEESHE